MSEPRKKSEKKEIRQLELERDLRQAQRRIRALTRTLSNVRRAAKRKTGSRR